VDEEWREQQRLVLTIDGGGRGDEREGEVCQGRQQRATDWSSWRLVFTTTGGGAGDWYSQQQAGEATMERTGRSKKFADDTVLHGTNREMDVGMQIWTQ